MFLFITFNLLNFIFTALVFLVYFYIPFSTKHDFIIFINLVFGCFTFNLKNERQNSYNWMDFI